MSEYSTSLKLYTEMIQKLMDILLSDSPFISNRICGIPAAVTLLDMGQSYPNPHYANGQFTTAEVELKFHVHFDKDVKSIPVIQSVMVPAIQTAFTVTAIDQPHFHEPRIRTITASSTFRMRNPDKIQ